MNKTSKSKAETVYGNPLWTCVHGWGDDGRCIYCHKSETGIITRMEAMQQRFGRLQLEDRKPSFWDRIMSDPNRRDRYDDALLEAHMEDAENWQYHGPAEMEDQ